MPSTYELESDLGHGEPQTRRNLTCGKVEEPWVRRKFENALKEQEQKTRGLKNDPKHWHMLPHKDITNLETAAVKPSKSDMQKATRVMGSSAKEHRI